MAEEIVAPELLQPGSFTETAEAGTKPGFQYGSDTLGNSLRALAEFIALSPITSEEQRGPLLQTLAKQREMVRQDRASKQLQFVTSHLSEAFASGDAARIGKAIKEVTSIENMEPEVAKVVQQQGLSFSEQLGKIASARDEQQKQSQAVADALEATKMGASRVEVAQMLARRGVDPKLIDDISKLLPEPKPGIQLAPGAGYFERLPSGELPTEPTISMPAAPKEPRALTREVEDLLLSKSALGQPLQESELATLGVTNQEQAKAVLENIRKTREQEKLSVFEQQRKIAAEQAAAARAVQPAPPGTYLDKKGNTIFPTSVGEVQSLNLRKLDQRQEIIHASAENWSVHNDMVLQYLDILAKEGMRPLTSMKATLQRFNNNPRARALFDQLEALTPFAASAVTAAGSSMRGGAMAARMLQPSTVVAGDTLEGALEKLSNNYQLSIQRAKYVGANTAPYQRRLDMVSKMQAGKGYIVMAGFEPIFIPNR